MNVNQLMAKLRTEQKAGNGKLQVGYAHGDNSEHEVAGWCVGLVLLEKADYIDADIDSADRECLENLPDAILVIRG